MSESGMSGAAAQLRALRRLVEGQQQTGRTYAAALLALQAMSLSQLLASATRTKAGNASTQPAPIWLLCWRVRRCCSASW